MEAIKENDSGLQVEDIQLKLESLGYKISSDEIDKKFYGKSTSDAVLKFRVEHSLPLKSEIDLAVWSALVDECYKLGDRTLYLRLPNFQGNDVKMLQNALNVLGFSCGAVDGFFGAHTEAAVKKFQENIGLMPDGMCFKDTIDAILRLHHAWEDKASTKDIDQIGIGFARAASVLEDNKITIVPSDPIARNISGRIWNLAGATSDRSKLTLVSTIDDAPTDTKVIFEITCEQMQKQKGIFKVNMDDAGSDFALRLKTSFLSSKAKIPYIVIILPSRCNTYDGTFTSSDSQVLAGILLDAICNALAA